MDQENYFLTIFRSLLALSSYSIYFVSFGMQIQRRIYTSTPQKAVQVVRTTKTMRRIATSHPKYSAIPPQTPASHLSVVDLVSRFLYSIGLQYLQFLPNFVETLPFLSWVRTVLGDVSQRNDRHGLESLYGKQALHGLHIVVAHPAGAQSTVGGSQG